MGEKRKESQKVLNVLSLMGNPRLIRIKKKKEKKNTTSHNPGAHQPVRPELTAKLASHPCTYLAIYYTLTLCKDVTVPFLFFSHRLSQYDLKGGG